MRPAHATCGDCHADAHGGQRARAASRSGGEGATTGTCESCHRVAGWSTIALDRAAHPQLPLEGRHAKAACTACHAAARPGLSPLAASEGHGRAGVVFRIGDAQCAWCHADPHAGRFATAAARGAARECQACHDARAFRPSTIDVAAHARFAFALDGAHAEVTCAACHRALERPRAPRGALRLAKPAPAPLSLVATEGGCRGCHASPHGAQFARRRDGGACESCHTTAAFVPASRFDHAQTAFPLTGGHSGVPCAGCHRSRGGSGAVVYAISPRCESCHGGSPPAARSGS